MDPWNEFQRKRDEETAKVVKPTILVCGYTGSGKTSLIQAICGKDIVPDERIGVGKPVTQGFVKYQNEFINIWDSKGLESGQREAEFLQTAKSLVRKLQDDPDVANHIHLVWYTILGPGSRVTSLDIELIRKVFPQNVIVLITKDDKTEPEERDAMIQELESKGVSSLDILAVSKKKPETLLALTQECSKRLPSAYQNAFNNAQMIDLSAKRTRSQLIIHGAAAAAGAAALNPLPISDAFVITPIQIGMIASLSLVYNLPTEGAKAVIGPSIAEVAGVMTASSLTKLWPGMGSLIQAGVASSLTEVIGQLADQWMIRCCEARRKGEAMPGFDMPFTSLAGLLIEYKKKKPNGDHL